MLGSEPAFPGKRYEMKTRPEGSEFPIEVEYAGMTVRQYFVAQAMMGLIASPGVGGDIARHADAAVQYADACLDREAETRKP
jgi:hypothetical protein